MGYPFDGRVLGLRKDEQQLNELECNMNIFISPMKTGNGIGPNIGGNSSHVFGNLHHGKNGDNIFDLGVCNRVGQTL